MERPQAERIAAAYRRFAADEARGRSPLYETLAQNVAGDPEVIAFLAALPPEKRQPNLLFGAMRYRFGTMPGWPEFPRVLLDNAAAVRELMRARSTQTNEPGRCAALLPVLAMLPQPLALIEVGASAGLCLLPDFYGYDYGGRILRPPDPEAPCFPCAAGAGTPLPGALPTVVWRAGLDLDPVDIADPDRAAWLRALVWPEQTGRLARLDAAMRIAAAQPPRLVRGDLRHDVAALAAQAPRDATRVIFHTAVLGYVADRDERSRFARSVRSLCDYWIANEAPQVFPDLAARAGAAPRITEPTNSGLPQGGGRFLLSLNGRPCAWTDPHGTTIDWIAEAGACAVGSTG